MLALGDSYTIGECVTVDARWPVQLAALLRTQGHEVADPLIVAQTGWTTDELSAALDRCESDFAPPYDLVTLLIGVNNQYRGRSLDEYADQFDALLTRAECWAGAQGKLRVLSIPDWGVTPFARNDARSASEIAQQIDEFNERARAICERRQVCFIDITGWSREAATRPQLLSSDGLHPSALEYRRWAKKVLASLEGSTTTEPALKKAETGS